MKSNNEPIKDNLDFNILLHNLPAAILLVDYKFNIVFINYAAETLFGETSNSLSNKNLKNFLSLDNQLYSLIDKVLKQKYNATQYDITINDLKKQSILVDIEAGLHNDKYIILCLHKRSIAEQIDRRVVQKSIHSVSGLSALMSHEIKNPLSGIKGAAQLLEDVVVDEDKELTSLIINEVDRIGELVDRVGSISDNNIVSRTKINIHDILQRVNRLAKASFAKNCNIIELYDPSLPEIYGDMNSLIQVFLNLVKNAAESKKDGVITIQTGYRHGFNIQVSGSNNRLKLPIFVNIIDNGPGIPEGIRSHLFEPFVTSKYGGSGLGLSIVSSIVEEHGGIIEVKSDKTTIFTVLFPALEEVKK